MFLLSALNITLPNRHTKAHRDLIFQRWPGREFCHTDCSPAGCPGSSSESCAVGGTQKAMAAEGASMAAWQWDKDSTRLFSRAHQHPSHGTASPDLHAGLCLRAVLQLPSSAPTKGQRSSPAGAVEVRDHTGVSALWTHPLGPWEVGLLP